MNYTQTAYHHACEVAANELLNLNGNPKPRTAQELAEKWGVEAHHIQEMADRIRARLDQQTTQGA